MAEGCAAHGEAVCSPEAWAHISDWCTGEPRGAKGCMLLTSLRPSSPSSDFALLEEKLLAHELLHLQRHRQTHVQMHHKRHEVTPCQMRHAKEGTKGRGVREGGRRRQGEGERASKHAREG